MRAELKSLFSPDADPLQNFAPIGSFGILVQAMIGPQAEEGYESFDFMLCTPDWFASNMRSDIETGRHHLFVRDFNYWRLEQYLRDYCRKCGESDSWPALAEKLSRLGMWEFEDYKP